MKKIIFFISIVFLFFSCKEHNNKTSDKLIITTSIEPIADIVKALADTMVNINILLPKGYSPENYELSVSNLKYIEKSDIYFAIGNLGFENGKFDKIQNNNKNTKIINLSNNKDLAHLNSEYDPHIWTSPKSIIDISNIIKDALIETDTIHSGFYKDRYEKFISEYNKTKTDIYNKLSERGQKSFVIYHPSLSEYAKEFGLEQLVIEVKGKEPNVKQLRSLIDRAKALNTKIVFVQKEFDSNMSKTIANEIGAKIVNIDPLGDDAMSTIWQVTNALLSDE